MLFKKITRALFLYFNFVNFQARYQSKLISLNP